MNQYKTRAQLKNIAREKMTGKYGSSILMYFTQTSILFGVSFALIMIFVIIAAIMLLLNEQAEIGIGFQLVFTLLSAIISMFGGVFNTGSSLFYLNVVSGRICSVSDLFYGFRYLFKKSLSLSAVTAIFSTLCLLPYDIFYFYYSENPTPETGMATLFSFLIGMVIYIPFSLALSQCYFLLLDFPQYSAKELLGLSVRIMKGKKWTLFCLQMSFFPLMLLGYLSFGIGLLWVTPYMNATLACYFLDIMKPAGNQGTTV